MSAVTILILHKDRTAQLALLQKSIRRNWPGQVVQVIEEPAGPLFEQRVCLELSRATDYVCFMCDDGILYRSLLRTKSSDMEPSEWLSLRDVLCLSLRLGENTTWQYPTGLAQQWPLEIGYGQAWAWREEVTRSNGDFGYPGSVDAHIFRRTDLIEMLDGRQVENPTALECAMVEGCNELADRRSLMACYPHSVYVGVPVNRVSEQSGVRFGVEHPQTVEWLNERVLDLDAIDFTGVNGAHTELRLT